LQEGIYGAPPEKFLPILTRIRSNGKHLLGLINLWVRFRAEM